MKRDPWPATRGRAQHRQAPTLAGCATVLLLFGFGSLTLAAQSPPKPEEVVSLRAEPAQLRLQPGGTARLKLKAEIRAGFHINSNQPLEEYLIPTEAFLPDDSDFELADASYPEAELKTFSFAPGEKLAVYEGTVEIGLRLRPRPTASRGTHKLALGLRYQACNDQICLRPAERRLTLTIQVQPTATGKPSR